MDIPKSWRWGNSRYRLVAEHYDGSVQLVIYKHWVKSKQCWQYFTDERSSVEWKLQQISPPGGRDGKPH